MDYYGYNDGYYDGYCDGYCNGFEAAELSNYEAGYCDGLRERMRDIEEAFKKELRKLKELGSNGLLDNYLVEVAATLGVKLER